MIADHSASLIANLKPYPEYKESGLPWLGQVPRHWEVLPLARLARPKSIVNQTERQLLSVYLHRGVLRFADVEEKRTNATSEDLSQYQVVDPGDFVLNNQQAWRGSVGVSGFAGVVSPAYLVLALSERYSPHYANLLFRDQCMVSQYLVCSKGVGTIQRNLYWPHLKRVGAIIPSPAEQAAIVRFLDFANGRLERVIQAKRKVIALLHEQKQAIIHRAVTCGLDPTVPLKPSGIPWLGDIPKHWEVQRLKRFCCVQGGYAFPSSAFGETGIPVVRMNNLRRGVLNFSAVARIPESECVPAFSLNAGDILYGLSGSIGATGSLGNYAVVAENDLPAMLNQRVARFVPKRDRIEPNFLIQLVQSSIFYEQVLADTTGTAQFNVSTNDIENVTVGIPPLDEQKHVVSRIGESVAPLATTISRLEREIELLREYRTRLVADVVTGKLDVREVASLLPEERDASDDVPLQDDDTKMDEQDELSERS